MQRSASTPPTAMQQQPQQHQNPAMHVHPPPSQARYAKPLRGPAPQVRMLPSHGNGPAQRQATRSHAAQERATILSAKGPLMRVPRRKRTAWGTDPAYVKFYGGRMAGYPPQFANEYGYGSSPGRYYPGLTPRDVVLARGKVMGDVTSAGTTMRQPLYAQEISSTRYLFSAFTSFMNTGLLPSNESLFAAIDGAMDSLSRAPPLTEDGEQVLDCLINAIRSFERMLAEKNQGEVMQRLVYHLTLARRSAAEHKRRVQQSMAGTLEYVAGEPAPGAEFEAGVPELGSLIRLVATSPDFRSVIRDWIDLARDLSSSSSSSGGQGGYGTYRPGSAAPMADGGDVVAEMGFEPEDGAGATAAGWSTGWEQQQVPSPERHVRFTEEPAVAGAAPMRQPMESMPAEGIQRGPPMAAGGYRVEPMPAEERQYGYAQQGPPMGGGYRVETMPAEGRQYEYAQQGPSMAAGGYRVETMPAQGRQYRKATTPPLEKRYAMRVETPTRYMRTTPQRRMFKSTTLPYAYRTRAVPTPQPTEIDYAARLRQPMDPMLAYRVMENFRQLMRRMRQWPQFTQAIRAGMSMIAEMGAVSGHETSTGAGQYGPSFRQRFWGVMQHDANRRAFMEDAKVLLERFAGGYKFDKLIAIIDEFQLRYRESWPLRDFLNEARWYLEHAVTSERYIDSADFVPKGVDLINRGRQLLGQQHPQLINALMHELFTIVWHFQQDQATNEFAESLQNLVDALLYDQQTGKLSLKTNLFQDFRNAVLPSLTGRVHFIPLPRIEINSDDYDLAFDNIVLGIENIVPSLMEFSMTNELQVSPRPDLPSAYFLNVITINAYQIQLDVRDAEFAFRKYTFPRIDDMGLADLFVGGNGLTIRTKVAVDPNLWYTTLVPLEIEADIDRLSVRVHDSRHDALYKMLSGPIVKRIKARLCRAIEARIYEMIARMDAVVTEASQGAGGQKPALAEKILSLW